MPSPKEKKVFAWFVSSSKFVMSRWFVGSVTVDRAGVKLCLLRFRIRPAPALIRMVLTAQVEQNQRSAPAMFASFMCLLCSRRSCETIYGKIRKITRRPPSPANGRKYLIQVTSSTSRLVCTGWFLLSQLWFACHSGDGLTGTANDLFLAHAWAGLISYKYSLQTMLPLSNQVSLP